MQRLLLFFVVMMGCSFPACGSGLPRQMPADFRLRYYVGGGMDPLGETLEIFPGGKAKFTEHFMSEDAGFEFVLTVEEMQNLYRLLVENNFDHIKSNGGFAHDKGGESIDVTVNKKNYSFSTSGTDVASSFKSEWSTITKALDTFIGQKRRNFETTVVVEFEPSLTHRYTNLNFNNRGAYTGTIPDAGATRELKLLPGTYEANVQTILNYDPKKYEETREINKRSHNRRFILDTNKTHHLVIGFGTDEITVTEK